MDHIGMDVHKKESQLCILAEGGELIERRIHTEPQRFAAVLGDRPRARILIEASTDSEWVARCLDIKAILCGSGSGSARARSWCGGPPRTLAASEA